MTSAADQRREWALVDDFHRSAAADGYLALVRVHQGQPTASHPPVLGDPLMLGDVEPEDVAAELSAHIKSVTLELGRLRATIGRAGLDPDNLVESADRLREELYAERDTLDALKSTLTLVADSIPCAEAHLLPKVSELVGRNGAYRRAVTNLEGVLEFATDATAASVRSVLLVLTVSLAREARS